MKGSPVTLSYQFNFFRDSSRHSSCLLLLQEELIERVSKLGWEGTGTREQGKRKSSAIRLAYHIAGRGTRPAARLIYT